MLEKQYFIPEPEEFIAESSLTKEMKKIKETMMKNIESIFDKCQMNDESVEYYHDEIYFRLMALEDERHSKKMESLKQSMKNVKIENN